MSIRSHKFSTTMFALVIGFLYLPLMLLIAYSFNDGKTMQWQGFSLRWYGELFNNSRPLWDAVRNSLIIAASSATVSTLIGTLAAIGVAWYRFKLRTYVQLSTFLPLILPEIIIGVSMLIFFANVIHLPLGLFTIFVAHTTFNIPFVMLMVMSRLEEFDYSIIEASRDLGAREIDTLIRIIVPISMPGIMAGFLTAVTLSLEDFVITFFVAGPGSSTLPLYVYSMIRFGVSPTINALSVVLISATVILAISTRNILKYIAK